MRRQQICLMAACCVFSVSQSLAQPIRAPSFPMDTPMRMRAIEAVCTGVSEDSRNDPRWTNYRLRVEVVGAKGEYLGATRVTISKDGEALASVDCGGPWVLFTLPAGAYSVTAEFAGASRTARVNVAATGQARLILRFADSGK